MEEDGLRCIEVSIDPTGPTLEESIELWNRILEKKSLIITGPVTQSQLNLLVDRLNPQGLFLDIDLVAADHLSQSFDWDKTKIGR